MTVERLGSFIGLSVAEIRGMYLELNLSKTRIQLCIHVRVWKHPTRSSCFKSRVFQLIKSRVSIVIKSCISTIIESRTSTIIESRVSTPLKFTFTLDQHGGRIYESCVLSHRRSMSLLLQSVQQYTGSSN